jgi:hypothetical protein
MIQGEIRYDVLSYLKAISSTNPRMDLDEISYT